MKTQGEIKTRAMGSAALLAIGVGFMNWAEAQEQAEQQTWQQAEPIHFETLSRGRFGDCTEPLTLHVGSELEWDREMKRLQEKGGLWASNLPPAPFGVDWGRESVVLVSLGEKMQAGYEVEIRRVSATSEALLLDLQITTPGGEEELYPYYPYHMARIQKVEAERIETRYTHRKRGPEQHALDLDEELMLAGAH